MNPQDAQSQMELLRRRAMGNGSSAGIGAERANSLSPDNPIAAGGTQAMTNPPTPSGGAAGSPSAGAVEGMKQQKAESETLVNALIYRLKKLTERGE